MLPRSRHSAGIVPTTELAHASSTITNEESELVRYDVEIKRLNRIVKKPKAEQSLLRKQLTIHRSWVAPIRGLSLEIITEIFNYVFLSEDYSLSITSNGRRVLLTASHAIACVCSLDGTCCVPTLSLDGHLRKKPLSIHVTIPSWTLSLETDEDYATCHLGLRGLHVFLLLLEESARVETLSLHTDMKSTIFESFQPIMTRQCSFTILRSLRSFEVNGDENFDNFDFDQACPPWLLDNGIAIAPKLAILRIHQLLFEHPPPYRQLMAHLDVQWDENPGYLLCALEMCAKLQVLQVLHIGVSHSAFAQIRIFFGSLILPSLHTLELRFHMKNVPPDNRPIMGISLGFPALLDMLIHICDKLKKLSLTFFLYIPHGDIFEVLESCPSLETLELRFLPRQHHFQCHSQLISFLIRRLTLGAHSWGTRNPPLLSKLQKLFIHAKNPATSSPDEVVGHILDVIESRSRSMSVTSTDADHNTSLQNVSISFRNVEEHSWEDIKDCRTLLSCSMLLDRLATLEPTRYKVYDRVVDLGNSSSSVVYGRRV
uniref:F-box domain-containing protein n=1 Tax=Moniliophthora roreri TaxID=221103 RepID=A0A0W0G909_MONRR